MSMHMRKKNKLNIKVMFCLMVACELMVMTLANVIFKDTLVIVYGNFAIEIFTTLYVISNVIQLTDFLIKTVYHNLPDIENTVQLGNWGINKWAFTSTTGV